MLLFDIVLLLPLSTDIPFTFEVRVFPSTVLSLAPAIDIPSPIFSVILFPIILPVLLDMEIPPEVFA